MVDLYGRQIQREGVNAIRNSLNVGQQASETQQAVPVTGQPVTPQSAGTLPLIDTSDALGSLATLLGPTPAEREARLRRMQQDKAKMAAWTGLFDGLARLGNLYYATKGAAPQQLGNPYEQVEKTAQHASQLADDMDTYRRQYTQQLYALRRQAGEDRRKNMLTEAQANYYNTRDEVARLKAENDKLKADAAIRNTEARTANTEAKTKTEEAMRQPKIENVQSSTNKNNRMGYGGRSGGGRSNGTYGYRTTRHVDPATGDIITERVPTTGGTPSKTVQKKKVVKW